MNAQPTAPSTSASLASHAPSPARCACEQQSMSAVPWILAAAAILLGLNMLSGRRKAAARLQRPS